MPGYGSDEAFAAWLASIGAQLPNDAPSPAVARELGAAYLDAAYGSRFKGMPTEGVNQEHAWPRTGAVVYGDLIPSAVVPASIERASYRAALLITDGQLSAAISIHGRRIKREKVEGAAEREFFDDGLAASGGGHAFDPALDGLLQPFLSPVIDGSLQALWVVG